MPFIIKRFLELQVGAYEDFPLCSHFNPLQSDNALSRTLFYTAPRKLKDNEPALLQDIKARHPRPTRSEPVHCKVQPSTANTLNYMHHSIKVNNAPLFLLETQSGHEASRPKREQRNTILPEPPPDELSFLLLFLVLLFYELTFLRATSHMVVEDSNNPVTRTYDLVHGKAPPFTTYMPDATYFVTEERFQSLLHDTRQRRRLLDAAPRECDNFLFFSLDLQTDDILRTLFDATFITQPPPSSRTVPMRHFNQGVKRPLVSLLRRPRPLVARTPKRQQWIQNSTTKITRYPDDKYAMTTTQTKRPFLTDLLVVGIGQMLIGGIQLFALLLTSLCTGTGHVATFRESSLAHKSFEGLAPNSIRSNKTRHFLLLVQLLPCKPRRWGAHNTMWSIMLVRVSKKIVELITGLQMQLNAFLRRFRILWRQTLNANTSKQPAQSHSRQMFRILDSQFVQVFKNLRHRALQVYLRFEVVVIRKNPNS